MGQKSRLKWQRRMERGSTASPTIDNIDRRKVLLGLGTLVGLSAVGGGAAFWHQSMESLEDRIAPYGRIIHEQNKGAETRLYIIGQTHYLEELNTPPEVGLSQTQIYRIIEAIGASEREYPLVLDEGRFVNFDYYQSDREVGDRLNKTMSEFFKIMTDQDIANFIVKNASNIHVSAVDFHVAANGVNVQGYEQQHLHQQSEAVVKHIFSYGPRFEEQRKREEAGLPVKESLSKIQGELDELYKLGDYFTDLRSLSLLQNSPQVVEREYKLSRNTTTSGIAVIGNRHLEAIVDFVKNGRAVIPGVNPQIFTDFGNLPDINQKLDLSNYHIIVIQPLSK